MRYTILDKTFISKYSKVKEQSFAVLTHEYLRRLNMVRKPKEEHLNTDQEHFQILSPIML